MTIFDGLFTGFTVGAVFALPAMITETLRPDSRMPLLMDVETFWGKKLSEGWVIISSAIVHLGMSTLYGVFIPLLVFGGTLSPLLPLRELLVYSVGFNIFIGVAALPIVGFGFFGHKEGGFVWLELLVTHILYAFAHWALFQLFFV